MGGGGRRGCIVRRFVVVDERVSLVDMFEMMHRARGSSPPKRLPGDFVNFLSWFSSMFTHQGRDFSLHIVLAGTSCSSNNGHVPSFQIRKRSKTPRAR